jgi:YidC/Oxa1 family membrane protein insertase
MANLRPMLLMTLVFLGYLLWVEWQKDYATVKPAPVTTEAPVPEPVTTPGSDLATVPVQNSGDVPTPVTTEDPALPTKAVMRGESPVVTVTTDVLELEIDLTGGTVVSARLLDYPETLAKPNEKVRLLQRFGEDLFIAQSGLLSSQAAPNHTSTYQSDRLEYTMPEGANELRIPLTWQDDSGIRVTKTFILQRGDYAMTVRHTISNGSQLIWSGNAYEQLQRGLVVNDEGGGFNNPERYSFKGIGIYSPEDKFEKIDFDDVASEPLQRSFSGGWLAMIQHYFFAAWIPPAGEINTYSTQEYSPTGLPRYIVRAVSPAQSINPGGSHEYESRLYIGPKLQDHIDGVAPGLELTVNYGIFTMFSAPLFWLLSKIHSFVGNWGWAIILLTLLIKGVFFKLTEAQYRSMARMRKLQPRIDQLKERFGDDRQRMSQAMMEMYKKEKVNPLGGCLPILVQIPVFIALYWVLIESVELRQAPFALWIQNLSERDPYFILPVLNGFFMIMTQRLTPAAGMDPMQRKIMNMMPIVFSVMFAFFPAGLVLYWATNAGLSLAQQWYITRKIAAQP